MTPPVTGNRLTSFCTLDLVSCPSDPSMISNFLPCVYLSASTRAVPGSRAGLRKKRNFASPDQGLDRSRHCIIPTRNACEQQHQQRTLPDPRAHDDGPTRAKSWRFFPLSFLFLESDMESFPFPACPAPFSPEPCRRSRWPSQLAIEGKMEEAHGEAEGKEK